MTLVCVQKTRLFTAVLLEDGHEIALNSLIVEYLFFERRLLGQDSLLLRVMAMYSSFLLATLSIRIFRYVGVPQL